MSIQKTLVKEIMVKQNTEKPYQKIALYQEICVYHMFHLPKKEDRYCL